VHATSADVKQHCGAVTAAFDAAADSLGGGVTAQFADLSFGAIDSIVESVSRFLLFHTTSTDEEILDCPMAFALSSAEPFASPTLGDEVGAVASERANEYRGLVSHSILAVAALRSLMEGAWESLDAPPPAEAVDLSNQTGAWTSVSARLPLTRQGADLRLPLTPSVFSASSQRAVWSPSLLRAGIDLSEDASEDCEVSLVFGELFLPLSPYTGASALPAGSPLVAIEVFAVGSCPSSGVFFRPVKQVAELDPPIHFSLPWTLPEIPAQANEGFSWLSTQEAVALGESNPEKFAAWEGGGFHPMSQYVTSWAFAVKRAGDGHDIETAPGSGGVEVFSFEFAAQCVFWDVSSEAFSDVGTDVAFDGRSMICRTTHLTDFGVLIAEVFQSSSFRVLFEDDFWSHPEPFSVTNVLFWLVLGLFVLCAASLVLARLRDRYVPTSDERFVAYYLNDFAVLSRLYDRTLELPSAQADQLAVAPGKRRVSPWTCCIRFMCVRVRISTRRRVAAVRVHHPNATVEDLRFFRAVHSVSSSSSSSSAPLNLQRLLLHRSRSGSDPREGDDVHQTLSKVATSVLASSGCISGGGSKMPAGNARGDGGGGCGCEGVVFALHQRRPWKNQPSRQQ